MYIALYIIAGGLIAKIALRAITKHLRKKNAALLEEICQPHPDAEEETDDTEEGLPEPTDNFDLVPLTTKTVRWGECGHYGPARFCHDLYGDKIEPKEEVFKAYKKHLCGACMQKMLEDAAIRCCACGFVILPGDPVAVYMNSREMNAAWKTHPEDDQKRVIGCLRWNCACTGAAFCGHWTGAEIKYAFPHGGSAMEEAFTTGKAVVGTFGPGSADISVIDVPSDPENKKN